MDTRPQDDVVGVMDTDSLFEKVAVDESPEVLSALAEEDAMVLALPPVQRDTLACPPAPPQDDNLSWWPAA